MFKIFITCFMIFCFLFANFGIWEREPNVFYKIFATILVSLGAFLTWVIFYCLN